MNDEVPHDTAIWRYMDLPKFLAMLVSNSMWFAKAATFDDGYEGFCRVIEPGITDYCFLVAVCLIVSAGIKYRHSCRF